MRLRPVLIFLLILLALSACQIALPGKTDKAGAPAASPITGGEITVTTLDAPASVAKPGTAPVPGQKPADPAKAQAEKPAAPPVGTAKPGPDASATGAAAPDAAEKDTSATDPAAENLAAEPAEPEVVKSVAQLACEKRGGRWSAAGSTDAAFCQSPTRDGGQSCKKASDCAGYCLAKSMTCAPVTPLFGCHDILTEEGRMLTQCIN